MSVRQVSVALLCLRVSPGKKEQFQTCSFESSLTWLLTWDRSSATTLDILGLVRRPCTLSPRGSACRRAGVSQHPLPEADPILAT